MREQERGPVAPPGLLAALPAAQTRTGPAPAPVALAGWLAQLAHEALLVEVHLTPKPGLVDRRNCGAHSDMTIATFEASAAALAPYFEAFVTSGMASTHQSATAALGDLRRIGLAGEAAMNAATGGVNTHKGAIFAFGLLLGAAGRRIGRAETLLSDPLCAEVAAIASGIVAHDLNSRHRTATTAGEYVHRRYGISGARGEAESGFATVREIGLPALRAARAGGADADRALLAALVALLTVNDDTNLVARGGPEGRLLVRAKARAVQAGGPLAPDFIARLEAFDDMLNACNLSPGGTADLVGITWFLWRLDSARIHP